ncbi:MAG TPA: hypothetical protein VEI97_13315 [bacterium]|nr:hypothetical protein [bacterium]
MRMLYTALLSALLTIPSAPVLAQGTTEERPPRQAIADARSGLPGSRAALQLETLSSDLSAAATLFFAHHGRRPTDFGELQRAGLVLFAPVDVAGQAVPMQAVAEGGQPPAGVIGVHWAEEGSLTWPGVDPATAAPAEYWLRLSTSLAVDLGGHVPLDQRLARLLRSALTQRWNLYKELHEREPVSVAAMLAGLGWAPNGGQVLAPNEPLPAGMLAVWIEAATHPEGLLVRYRSEPAEIGPPSYPVLFPSLLPGQRPTSRLFPRQGLALNQGLLAAQEMGDANFASLGGVAIPRSADAAIPRRPVSPLPVGPTNPQGAFPGLRGFGSLLREIQQLLKARHPEQPANLDFLRRAHLLVEVPRVEGAEPVRLNSAASDGLPPAGRAPGWYLGSRDGVLLLTLADAHRNRVITPPSNPNMPWAEEEPQIEPAIPDARERYLALIEDAPSDPALVVSGLSRLLNSSDHWDDLRLGLFLGYFEQQISSYLRSEGAFPVSWDQYLNWSGQAPLEYVPQPGPVQPQPGEMALTLERDTSGRVIRVTVQPAVGPAVTNYWTVRSFTGRSSFPYALTSASVLDTPELPYLHYRPLMATLVPTGGP